MHCILGRWKRAKVDHSYLQILDKDEAAKISIPRHKDAALLLGCLEQFYITCLRKADSGYRNDVMAQAAQEASSNGVHVLIQKELHAGTAAK